MTLRSKQGSSRVPQALLVCAILSAACGATSGGGVGGAGGMGPGGADVGGDRGGGAGVGGARGGAGVGGDRGGGAGVGGASGGAGFGGQNPLGRTRCHAPAGVSAAPKTIEEAVALLNALPKPTTVACFVESLERPLSAVATSSIFSAQPAVSRESPRLFLKRDRLWLSVVVAGPSSQVLELSYVVDNELLRSTKGELQLPLEQTLALSAPYDRVQFSQGTVCGFCHASESLELTATFDNVFSSAVLRPRPDTYVALDGLRVENQNCDWQVEPERCEMLSAIFDGGPVNEAAFPESTPTFF